MHIVSLYIDNGGNSDVSYDNYIYLLTISPFAVMSITYTNSAYERKNN